MKERDWRDTLRVGDVLITTSGDLRVVRRVSHDTWGFTRCIDLVIRRCSWTRKPYTTISRNDLKQRGFRKAEVRSRDSVDLSNLTCWDVKGIA